MYDHVIVPFDGTSDARRAALVGSDLADLDGAELVLATVGDVAPVAAGGALKQHAVDMSDERATVWLEPGRSEADALLTMLSYRPSSLVCMYTHARTGLLRSVYGSLADDLLRSSDVPILLIGPHCRDQVVSDTGHLVVAVDRTSASAAAVALAAAWPDTGPMRATLVYAREPDEIAVNVDELVAPLEARCELVDKVVVDVDAYAEGLLSVARHSTNAIIVVAEQLGAARGGAHRRGGRRHATFVAKLAQTSPVPVLVRRAA